ncbi:AraC family transcriptional regulator [Jeongeupia sp. HS-3]|uniref:helix-turn-helix domain-containing protein n=1 Tax=Jeongeupia sp. HS-3 TaxID=1009682 RepID=UPI0018A5B6EF|nr:AraC family transcriptional regulator [Jeongeupia sp. HS-3]BCL75982.1 AraC family transcriptional regulator [Jeongeupia sp. HS-3]
MKANFEVITADNGESWAFFQRNAQAALPFNWHYHPEYELSLVLNASGSRYIGDHIGACDGADLVLTGPNLPHTWAVQAVAADRLIAVRVIWFTHEWIARLCATCPEFQPLLRWLADASRGLKFSDAALERVRPLIGQMEEATPMTRLILLLQVLGVLKSDQPIQLSSAAFSGAPDRHGENRITRVTQYLTTHYREPLDLRQLAALANLTVNSLCRAFRQHTRASISEYVARLRIGRACAELIDSNQPIATIAHDMGYRNLSHFNRQFRASKGMSPGEFRTRFHRTDAG